MTTPAQNAAEVAAATSIIASIVGWLPPIAAALGILWYCVLIYDRIKHGPKK